MLFGGQVFLMTALLWPTESGFFYIGKCFCLSGGEEQRNLKLSQLVRSSEPDCYTYTKTISGTNPKLANKVVPVYAQIEAHPRCLVYLLDNYYCRIPPKAFELDIFYLQPKTKFDFDSVWYDYRLYSEYV